MKVYKFGGASISNFDRINNLSHIIEEHKGEKILIVISAMGKITNALEKVVDTFYEGKKEEAFHLFEKVKTHHLVQLNYLVTIHWEKATEHLQHFFDEVEGILNSSPVKDYNYYYDQIVCTGELLSSTLISYYLNEKHLLNHWVDVRTIVKTDDTFRDGKINWELTAENIRTDLEPLFQKHDLVIAQGFIAGTETNESITLGREGSDYTAAIFAKILNAESVTIWKDVEGVMNADPREFPEAVLIENLSYKEVIEMSYYGAQVIHPKTIKPLQNNQIPLFVKSFLNPELPGTTITGNFSANLPPMMVYKRKQALITLQSLDFSFVEGSPINLLHDILDKIRLKPNLTQNTAISLLICVDDIPEKIEIIAQEASEIFDVQIQRNLTLLTIRHYNEESIKELSAQQKIVLEQKTLETVQILMREE